MKQWFTLLCVLGVGLSAGAQEAGPGSARDAAALERTLVKKVWTARREACPRDAVLETVRAYAQECDLVFRQKQAKRPEGENQSVRAFLSYIYKESGEKRFASSAVCALRRREAVRQLAKEEKTRGTSSGRSVLFQKLRGYFNVTPEELNSCRNSLLGRRAGISDDNQQPRRYNVPR